MPNLNIFDFFRRKKIDEIIERALSIASYEIASNPDKYSELIITEETIENYKREIHRLLMDVNNKKITIM